MNRNKTRHAPRPDSPRPRRTAVAHAVFVLWVAAVGAGVVLGGRRACDMPAAKRDRPDARVALTAGWEVLHTVPVSHPLAVRIVDQLVARGPQGEVREEVVLDGRARVLEERLRRAGWIVRVDGPPTEEPTVQIVSPDGTLRWCGRFRAGDFDTPGALMLDDAVLRRLARGEGAGPYVPVGCATWLDRAAADTERLFDL